MRIPSIFPLPIDNPPSSIHPVSPHSLASTNSIVNRKLSNSLVKLLTGCVMLLLVDCFASRAWAVCGDHVLSGKERADAARSTEDMPSHKPCSGPLCSRSKESTPVPPIPVRHQDDRSLPTERFALIPDSLTGVFETEPTYPISGLATSIFHPPRPCVR